MLLIGFGECNKNLIYSLIGGISNFIVNSLLYLFRDEVKLNKHPFILGINAGFGMSLAFIPYIYVHKCFKKTKEEKLNNKYIGNLHKKTSKIGKRKKYIIVLLCAFLDFLQKMLVFIFSYNITNNVWIFNIIFLNIFTNMIKKNPLYKHQYFSSGIMILFGIGLNVINLYKMKVEDIPALILSIFIEIIYSLAIVLAKYSMDDLYYSPYEITFYEGIFGLIMNIKFLIIASNMPVSLIYQYSFSKLFKISEYNGKKYLDNFYAYYDTLDFVGALLFLITMVGRVFFNLFSHITIKHFTSSHVVLLLIMGEISLDWKEKNKNDIVITAIIFAVELFMLLIFCEIIELNFCGFEHNTRKNIRERGESSIYDENENDTDSKDIGEGFLIENQSNLSLNDTYDSNM